MKRFLLVLLAVVLAVTLCSCEGDEKSAATLEVGAYITFGHYPQTRSGDDNTEIEWLVLDVQGSKALLLSRHALDYKPYNTTHTNVTWEKCTLRTWLNKDFINKAFTSAEQTTILTTNVDNSKNQGYSEWFTDGGNDTQDKVFLLSYTEANKYLGLKHYSESGATSNMESRSSETAYAKAQVAYTYNSSYKTSEGAAACNWWLRSPGGYKSSAADVYCDGSLNSSDVEDAYDAVRPAIWVNLKSLNYSENTAAISSTEKVETAATESKTEKSILKTPEELIVGTWEPVGNENRRGEDKILTLTFHEDGKVGGTDEGITWRIENNKFVISESGHADLYYSFSVTETELKLISAGDGETLTFTRGSNGNKTTSSAANDTTAEDTTPTTETVEAANTPKPVTRIGDEVVNGDYKYYKLSDGTIELTKYSGKADILDIPAQIDGALVTVIGRGAFRRNAEIKSITIPDGVTIIGEYAFSESKNLTNITIPDSVTSIGKEAFSWCSKLTDVVIPDNVTNIGRAAFCCCEKLTNVVIYGSVTSIEEGLFGNCSRLREVILPDSVRSIEPSAFSSCSKLPSIIIPEGVTSIGHGAFYGCSLLTEVIIPGSVTSIDWQAFYECYRLTSITIPASVTSIGQEAFWGCTKLTNVIVSQGSYAEKYCKNNKLRYTYSE